MHTQTQQRADVPTNCLRPDYRLGGAVGLDLSRKRCSTRARTAHDGAVMTLTWIDMLNFYSQTFLFDNLVEHKWTELLIVEIRQFFISSHINLPRAVYELNVIIDCF